MRRHLFIFFFFFFVILSIHQEQVLHKMQQKTKKRSIIRAAKKKTNLGHLKVMQRKKKDSQGLKGFQAEWFCSCNNITWICDSKKYEKKNNFKLNRQAGSKAVRHSGSYSCNFFFFFVFLLTTEIEIFFITYASWGRCRK